MVALGADALAARLRGEDGDGFVLLPGFAEPEVGRSMLEDVVSIARSPATARGGALLLEESQPDFEGEHPEDRVSKIFRLHRRPLFRAFLEREDVTALLTGAIGPDVDCFLSQFIFKNPGAWGQPWHQDAYYFPFDPPSPVLALWLAVTRATLENGCLHVLPGSQREPVHRHVRDRRPGALQGYVEIVDTDFGAARPCLLESGDLLLFDSHLMHRSTDNVSDGLRAAMVWHCARAGTVERAVDHGDGVPRKSPVHDWQPLLRDGQVVRGT